MMRPGLALACALAAGGAALLPVPALELANAERGRALLLPLAPGERFSVTFQHSMYDAPVTEELEVGPRGELLLRAVSSPSAAAREYLGLTGPGERQELSRAMPEVVYRVAAGAPQRLTVRGVDRSFLEVGERGDRLVLRAASRPAARMAVASLRSLARR